MVTYISGSNRKMNSYSIAMKLKDNNSKLFTLAGKNIKYCLGCDKCSEELEKFCVLNDDMLEIYKAITNSDKIVIISPVYFGHISGILKNWFDRLNPCFH